MNELSALKIFVSFQRLFQRLYGPLKLLQSHLHMPVFGYLLKKWFHLYKSSSLFLQSSYPGVPGQCDFARGDIGDVCFASSGSGCSFFGPTEEERLEI